MATARPLPRILLITGIPGIGKTTVLRKVTERLGDVRVCGFYTEELREQGIRRGFRLIGFDGMRLDRFATGCIYPFTGFGTANMFC